MILDYTLLVIITSIVTMGIILGIIFGKYQLINRYPQNPTPHLDLLENTEEINEFIIEETKERINQELQNMSADELKANVVGAISVVFTILVVSEFFRIFHNIVDEILWLPIILVSVTTIVLFISFLCGIKVLIPRMNRFNLWLPRDTNNSYSKKNIKTRKDFQKEFKEELINNFESIDSARKIDRYFIKWGYALLIGGSLISFITLVTTHIFWTHG